VRKKFPTTILTLLIFSAALVACGGSSSNSGTPNTIIVTEDPDVTNVDADGNTSVDMALLLEQLATIPVGELTAEEVAGLLFMREEEKLAFDVYTQLGAVWQQAIFDNIATAELTHTEAVLTLLERYELTDPVGSNDVGVFEDPILQGLYDLLVASGNASLIDALLVGAEIEEIDILDLETHLENLVENEDIELVYENLQKGSRNHLRAFVRVLDAQSFTYVPQHLSPEDYSDIVNTPTETGAP